MQTLSPLFYVCVAYLEYRNYSWDGRVSDETAKRIITFGGCWVKSDHVEEVVEAWTSSLAAGKMTEFRCTAGANVPKAPPGEGFWFHGGLTQNSCPAQGGQAHFCIPLTAE